MIDDHVGKADQREAAVRHLNQLRTEAADTGMFADGGRQFGHAPPRRAGSVRVILGDPLYRLQKISPCGDESSAIISDWQR